MRREGHRQGRRDGGRGGIGDRRPGARRIIVSKTEVIRDVAGQAGVHIQLAVARKDAGGRDINVPGVRRDGVRGVGGAIDHRVGRPLNGVLAARRQGIVIGSPTALTMLEGRCHPIARRPRRIRDPGAGPRVRVDDQQGVTHDVVPVECPDARIIGRRGQKGRSPSRVLKAVPRVLDDAHKGAKAAIVETSTA